MSEHGAPSLELDSLVTRCKAGDEVAWEALVHRLQGRIFAICYHYLRDREEAREVAQETFVRIYRGLRGFDASGSFLAWTVRIARNCSFDRLRKFERTPTHGASPMDEQTPLYAVRTRSEDAGERHALQDLLRKALDGMSALNREIVFLKDVEGLSQREIAEQLSIPLGTVKTRSHRARRELAKRMLELDPSYGAG